MATLSVTSKNSAAPIAPSKIAIAASGDILNYVPNTAQELYLYNTSASAVNVTLDGSTGTTIPVPGTAGSTFSVAAGLVVNVAANSFAVVQLDQCQAYLQGVVAITAATGAVVMASLVSPY